MPEHPLRLDTCRLIFLSISPALPG